MCKCIFCWDAWGSRCCAIWSFGSFVFLIFAGIVFTTAPYVKHVSPEEARTAAHNSFWGAGMYGATTLIAVIRFVYLSRKEDRARKRNEMGELVEPLTEGEPAPPRSASSQQNDYKSTRRIAPITET